MGINFDYIVYDDIAYEACRKVVKKEVDDTLFTNLMAEQGRFKLKQTLGGNLHKISPTDTVGIRPGEETSTQIAAKAASRAGAIK